ncbi:MAG: hypothetical protein ACI8S6_004726, partial [Myxococcota bacterium]
GHPAQATRIAAGHWTLDLERPRFQGNCRDIEVDDKSLSAFVEHRGQRGLLIDIEGLVTRGEQHGVELSTFGVISDDMDYEDPEEPHRGDEDDDTDTDYGEDTEDAPPPSEIREDSVDEPGRGMELPRDGATLTLEAVADGPRWMDGVLQAELVEDGEVFCSFVVDFSGWTERD